jgi:drug/metabolite transporter (DMT)-like permease
MSAPSWLWVALTLAAATAQTFRNVAQRSLTPVLGTVGATHIRFLFGLPFVLVALAVIVMTGGRLPALNATALLGAAAGGVCQIGATALMLAVMQERSFVVTTAYTKTEPLQIALFAVIFLGEIPTLPLVVAIVIATVGIVLLSWPMRGASELFSLRPAALGIGSGGLFALAAVGYRGALVAIEGANYLASATLVLTVTLAIQTVLLTVWLLLRDRGVMLAIFRAWRPSLAAGFLGGLASEMWFTSFAIRDAASVRTLGLVEILIAGFVSRRLFAQTPTLSEVVGLVLVVAGLGLLFSA